MYEYNAHIYNIVDGDTFDAEVDLGFRTFVKIRFRLNNLDTPETWRPKTEEEALHGEAATERAEELLLDKDVVIRTNKMPGIYGRWGANVTLPDGRNYSQVMVDEGFSKRDQY